MGPLPAELTGPGRELWEDASAFLAANGRANRVYRHGLLLVCRAYQGAVERGESGTKSLEAVRRWMTELQLTPASSAKGGDLSDDAKHEEGPARLLRLVNDKRSGG
jgi:hypothetical protein